MGKIFSRLGWPVALLLLVITLSIGIYIIINQPITDDNADISKLKPENKNFEKKLDETNNNEDINKNVSSEQNLKSDQIQNDEKDLSISQNIESKELIFEPKILINAFS